MMLQRPAATKWLWCLVALYAGPSWSPVGSVTVRTPPKNPTTIEAQAKFFQDFFSVQLSPYKIEFGHVCEDPNTWEQRYEKKDFKNHRDMGKVRWGDKQGGYGEHYWDLNHAGHAGDHGNDEYDGHSDDGSYNHDLDRNYDGQDGHDGHDDHNDHDAYDEPSEQAPTYATEEYDPEKAARYDENGRAKRAHPRVKTERKLIREEETYEEEPQMQPQKINRKMKERLQTASTQQVEKVADGNTDSDQQPPKRKRQQRRPQQHHENENKYEQDNKQDAQAKEESNNQEQLHQKQPQKQEQPQQQQRQQQQRQPEQPQQEQPQQHYYKQRQPENQFVPYEQGAGVRQPQRPDITAAASVPRLFLEPTTGHVVDRATGQAYVLQPIAINNYN